MDWALSWDKRSLPSAQYGAGSSGFQNASIKTGIALTSYFQIITTRKVIVPALASNFGDCVRGKLACLGLSERE